MDKIELADVKPQKGAIAPRNSIKSETDSSTAKNQGFRELGKTLNYLFFQLCSNPTSLATCLGLNFACLVYSTAYVAVKFLFIWIWASDLPQQFLKKSIFASNLHNGTAQVRPHYACVKLSIVAVFNYVVFLGINFGRCYFLNLDYKNLQCLTLAYQCDTLKPINTNFCGLNDIEFNIIDSALALQGLDLNNNGFISLTNAEVINQDLRLLKTRLMSNVTSDNLTALYERVEKQEMEAKLQSAKEVRKG